MSAGKAKIVEDSKGITITKSGEPLPLQCGPYFAEVRRSDGFINMLSGGIRKEPSPEWVSAFTPEMGWRIAKIEIKEIE